MGNRNPESKSCAGRNTLWVSSHLITSVFEGICVLYAEAGRNKMYDRRTERRGEDGRMDDGGRMIPVCRSVNASEANSVCSAM